MIDVEIMKARKKLRLELLEEVYNLHFGGEGQLNNLLIAKRDELMGERNSEKHLAYHYLLESGYIYIDNIEVEDGVVTEINHIKLENGYDYVAINILLKGIDYVESMYDLD
ncbi:hypothetical protein ACFSFY_12715 [Sporosarcina siberiensis]|uniref:Uncharacterized protein n=1 Tax=Sporosarcina siberiensis TaxID=1365606 RepID=A0ABW4SIH1_9BACL